MKGFLEEYGLIIVVVAVILLMLLFGKSGYAKSIQDAILGSANHIVETGENITKSDKKEVNVIASDMLDIEGTEYVVLEERENNQALVMTANKIKRNSFQSGSRSDGLPDNTYENSKIDNYLENDWYNSLSSTMKAAIQTTSIKQASYLTYDDPDAKQETGYNGQVYNTISRHAFLPSVSEIGQVLDLNSRDKIKRFVDYGYNYIWTRDSYQPDSENVMCLNGYGYLTYTYTDPVVNRDIYMRPAFVIDLSQVNYKVVGHTDYK